MLQGMRECLSPYINYDPNLRNQLVNAKKVALTINTVTGIKRFLDDKGYGARFNKLFSLVKTRDTCRAEQAIELSALVTKEDKATSSTESEPETKTGRLFVSVK